MNPTIKTAINIVGSQKKLGEACDVSQQAVYKWLHNKAKVSPEHVNSIVNATNGEVQAHQIRPSKAVPFSEGRSGRLTGGLSINTRGSITNGEFNDTQQSGGSQDRKLVTQPDS